MPLKQRPGRMLNRDSTPIFSALAPSYWAKGLPVIPLYYHEKRPIPEGWSKFCVAMPPAELQDYWVNNFANCNIGLPLGAQSNMVAVDIDSDRPEVMKIIKSVLPTSQWTRIGAKGAVLMYRNSGERSFQIKGIDGKVLVELLAHGRQVVLPPSIHPQTNNPYVADRDLLTVHNLLPALPHGVEEILRGAFESEGIELSLSGSSKVTDFMSVGQRDNQMTRLAGLLSWSITRGERSFKEAEGMMRAWHSQLIEKTPGDEIDINKGVRGLANFLVRDVLGEKKCALPKGWDTDMSEEEKASLGLTFGENSMEWSYTQLKDYLLVEFEKYGVDDNPQGRSNAVIHILDRIAHSPNLDSLDEERLLKFIAETSGLQMTLPALRKKVREMKSGDFEGLDHNNVAQAVIEDLEEFGAMRWYGGRIYQWAGSHWEPLEDTYVLKHIAERYGHLAAAKRNSDHNGILKTIYNKLERGLSHNQTPGVNFANGFLRTDLKLVEHDPTYGATYTLPFCYIPDATLPAKFHDFLGNSWSHSEDYEAKVMGLQEAVCATMFNMAAHLQRAFLLYGVPFSGKSVALDVICAMLPDNSRCAVPPDEWGDRFSPVHLHGKLLNRCGELSDKHLIDGRMFKLVVAGEEIQASFKGKDAFKFHPTCAHWFASNHLPRTDDTSEGFNRRWLIFHFDKVVPKADRIFKYGELIAAEERELIASWAVQAMGRLMDKKEYTEMTSHNSMIAEVANNNNSVRFFMTSGKVKFVKDASPDGNTPSLHISERKLHDVYLAFCLRAMGVKPVGQRAFRMKMRELANLMGFRVITKVTDDGMEECDYGPFIIASEKAS